MPCHHYLERALAAYIDGELAHSGCLFLGAKAPMNVPKLVQNESPATGQTPQFSIKVRIGYFRVGQPPITPIF